MPRQETTGASETMDVGHTRRIVRGRDDDWVHATYNGSDTAHEGAEAPRAAVAHTCAVSMLWACVGTPGLMPDPVQEWQYLTQRAVLLAGIEDHPRLVQ